MKKLLLCVAFVATMMVMTMAVYGGILPTPAPMPTPMSIPAPIPMPTPVQTATPTEPIELLYFLEGGSRREIPHPHIRSYPYAFLHHTEEEIQIIRANNPLEYYHIYRDDVRMVTADETGVHIHGRVLLTQEEIRTLLPFAMTMSETTMSPHPERAMSPYFEHWMRPHPERRMTEEEVIAWIEEYNRIGGMNFRELETLYLFNSERMIRGIHPLGVCPALNMASRLYNQIPGAGNHRDPFYGDPNQRVRIFWEVLFPNIRRVNGVGENTGSGFDGWMRSTGHRLNILYPLYDYVGLGIDLRATAKFSR